MNTHSSNPSPLKSCTKNSPEYKRLLNQLEKHVHSDCRHQENEAVRTHIYPDFKECPHFFSEKNTSTTHRVKAFTRQKIVVIAAQDLIELLNLDEFDIEFDNHQIAKGTLIRASEFPNHASEYDGITYTILISWKECREFEHLVKVNGVPVLATNQLDNISINGGGSGNRPPGEPIVEGDYSSISTFPVQSDYKKIRQDYQVGPVSPGSTTVAVMDTGSLFLLSTYKSALHNELKSLPLLKRASLRYPNGFCSVTSYLNKNHRKCITKKETQAEEMSQYEVLANPYDDTESRHGTTVSTLIAHASSYKKQDQLEMPSASILPIKCFDYLGAATLFDILCGFNYLFSRIKPDHIRIVNASWGLHIPQEKAGQLEILRKKIVALHHEGVFLLTSAGNRASFDTAPLNLEEYPIYPAYFSSDELDNVITVTTVAPTQITASTETKGQDTPISSDLEAVENFSAQYVDLGVEGHAFEGIFSSPFKDKQGKNLAPAILSGSSFATAYVSGYLAKVLADNPHIKTKNDFFQALSSIRTSSSLDAVIVGGKYLTLPKAEYAQCELYVNEYLTKANA